jgi:hypothetical protein
LSPYRIELHDERGDVGEIVAEFFADDDAAIDHAGRLAHRYEINVWQEDRRVARFPPL